MNLTNIRDRLAALKIVPSRKLGQNFLHDRNMIDCLLASADVTPGDLVVEIGPGLGALTVGLAAAAKQLLAIEYDVRLAAALQEQFSHVDHVRVIQADAARFDFDAQTAGAPWICVANLPYSVSTVILGRFLGLHNPPQRLQLLLQKEMADRLCAPPRNKQYGSLTVRTQSQYAVKLVRTVASSVFWPVPDVASAVVQLTRLVDWGTADERLAFDSLVRRAFSQRRKRAMKLLSGPWPQAQVEAAFDAAGLDHNVRAEDISVTQFRQLTTGIRDCQDG